MALKHKAFFFIGFCILLLSLSPLFVSAQTLPGIYVRDVVLNKTTFQKGEEVTGTFTIFNVEPEIISNIKYSVSVMGAYTPDGLPHLEYVTEAGPTTFSLGAKEEKNLSFSIKLPPNVAGNVGIEVQALLGSGVPLGWKTTFIAVTGESGLVEVYGHIDIDNEQYSVESGPTIPLDGSAKLNATTKNTTAGTLVLTPVLVHRNAIGNELKTEKGKSISVAAGKSVNSSFVVLGSSLPPGVYTATLSLLDAEGTERSNAVTYRYIIGGDIATIHSVTADVAQVSAGNTVNVEVLFSGAPMDISTSSYSGGGGVATLSVAIYNQSGREIGGETIDIDLDTEDSIILPVLVSASARELIVEAIITKEGKELARFKSSLGDGGPGTLGWPMELTVVGLLALLLSMWAVVNLKSSTTAPAPAMPAMPGVSVPAQTKLPGNAILALVAAGIAWLVFAGLITGVLQMPSLTANDRALAASIAYAQGTTAPTYVYDGPWRDWIFNNDPQGGRQLSGSQWIVPGHSEADTCYDIDGNPYSCSVWVYDYPTPTSASHILQGSPTGTWSKIGTTSNPVSGNTGWFITDLPQVFINDPTLSLDAGQTFYVIGRTVYYECSNTPSTRNITAKFQGVTKSYAITPTAYEDGSPIESICVDSIIGYDEDTNEPIYGSPQICGPYLNGTIRGDFSLGPFTAPSGSGTYRLWLHFTAQGGNQGAYAAGFGHVDLTVGSGGGAVNGACSSPQVHYTCSAGTSANNVQGASSWTWNCNGSGGGTNASCSEAISSGSPDYIIQNAPPAPGTGTIGTPMTFSAIVRNGGNAVGQTTSRIRFQIDTDANGTAYDAATDSLVTTSTVVPALAAGTNDVSRTSPSWTPTAAGAYRVRGEADMTGNRIAESNETNNYSPSRTFTVNPGSTQCSDGVDNDGDLKIDYQGTNPDSLGCTSWSDNDETDPPPVTQCNDGIDNTDPEDFLIDLADPGCGNDPNDTDETDPPSGVDLVPTNAAPAYVSPTTANVGTPVLFSLSIKNQGISSTVNPFTNLLQRANDTGTPGGACESGTVDIGGGVCRGFFTSSATFVKPSNWNNSNNTIECVGPGGTGSVGTSGRGGGGGAYAKRTNYTLAGNQAFTVGAGGTETDTVFGTACTADAGKNGGSAGAGAGGLASASVGDVGAKFDGGNGDNTSGWGGGGGAAGPSGAGKNGGDGGNAGSTGGGGGGGSNGTTSGGGSTAGSAFSGATGGNGGQGTGGTGGGAGGTTANGSPGNNGGGGGGGGASASSYAGGSGGSDTTWGSAGLGGGGGGGGRNTTNAANGIGGNGGLYGGGGGAASTAVGVGGPGAQGVIVVTYTPAGTPPTGIQASTTQMAALGSGASADASFWWTFQPGDEGTKYVRVCADLDADLLPANGVIAETNETNNCGAWTTITVSPALPQCSDNIDNTDGEDTLADTADPDCHTDGNPSNPGTYDPDDTSETPQCSDGVDNGDAEDALSDTADPDCHTDNNAGNPGSYDPTDDSESPQCADGRDNTDGEDTLPDTADPDCHTDGNPSNPGSYDPTDTSESPQCSDGVNNDGDSYGTDYPNDPGCASPTDTTESPNPQCSDGVNNDSEDTLIDMADTAGCSGPSDDDETNAPASLTLTASSQSVESGTSVTLTWSSSGPPVSNCSIDNGIGAVTMPSSGPSGPITGETTFTLTCTSGAVQVSKSVTVNVLPVFEEF